MAPYRGQGAFEYILMLSGVLLVVITITYMMQGSVTQADSTLDAQMKAAGVALDPSYYLPGAKPQFMPNSPADGAGSTARPNISALITVKDAQLYELKYNWNGANYSIYDQSLVLAFNFDDANRIGDSASKAVDVSSYGVNGTIYGNTVMLLHMDENAGSIAYDESRFGHNGGLAGTNWSDGKSGTGIYTDGTDDIITASSSGFTWPHVTTEFWYKHARSQSGTVFSYNIYGDGAPGSWFALSGNTLYAYYLRPDANTVTLGTSTLVPGNWYHITSVFNRMTSYAAFYVNGVKAGEIASFAPYQTWSYGSPVISMGAAYHWVATAPASNKVHDYTEGTFDEVAIHNRSLSASEVLAHYNAGRAKHAGWNANGKWGPAMSFDGIDDVVDLPDDGYLDFTNQDFTVSAWFSLAGYYSAGTTCKQSPIVANDDYGWKATVSQTGSLGFSAYHSSSTSSGVTAPAPISLGRFYFMTAVFSNATKTMALYLDGTLAASRSIPSGTIYYASANDQPHIGAITHCGGQNNYFNGTIDEVRIWNRALTPAEIAMQYRTSINRYTPNAWLFEYRNDSLGYGTYNYTVYTSGGYRKDASSETRTVKYCQLPWPC